MGAFKPPTLRALRSKQSGIIMGNFEIKLSGQNGFVKSIVLRVKHVIDTKGSSGHDVRIESLEQLKVTHEPTSGYRTAETEVLVDGVENGAKDKRVLDRSAVRAAVVDVSVDQHGSENGPKSGE